MSYDPRDSAISFSSFFVRRNLPFSTREECDAFARLKFSDTARIAPFQGYCSYTLIVGDDKILQFRPAEHGFDVDIVSKACEVFGDLAPNIEFLGILEDSQLHVYSMRKLSGFSLLDLRTSSHSSTAVRRQIIRDFADIQVMSWRYHMPGTQILEKGTVGSSLQWRIDMMISKLPERFKTVAEGVRNKLQDIVDLPWVMSHGDLIPANILVAQNPPNGRITGLLDWAEAEWLPLGVGMYGLEELLGEDVEGHFQYYPEAQRLRSLFWSELLLGIPELSKGRDFLQLVKEAQTLGIMLWHGIAFDDGKLDRVVEVGVDDGEIQRLDAFLFRGGSILEQTFWDRLRPVCRSFRNLLVHMMRSTGN